MNVLDVLLVVLLGAGAYGGWKVGVVHRALSWVGLVLGLLVSLRLLPEVLGQIDDAGDSWVLIAGLALMVGGAFCGQAIGILIGDRIDPTVPEWMSPVDRVAGAVVGFSGALMFVWFALPALSTVSSWPRAQYESSAVVDVIEATLPDPPSSARAFRNLVRADQFPDGLPPVVSTPASGVPPESRPLDQAVVTAVTRSIVHVEARACGRVQDGSGFVVAPEIVATNAHVVAGSGDELVVDSTGAAHDAYVVAFDPFRDLALVSVPDLDAPALEIGEAGRGDEGAVFGYPGGQEMRIAPYRVDEVVRANGNDLYQQSETQRRVLFVATDLEAGDSGAAMIDADGELTGIAFAVAPADARVAYALHTDELRALLDDVDLDQLDESDEVDTRDCL